MLEWDQMKDPGGEGKRFFNLFIGTTDEWAHHFLEQKYGGTDKTIYKFDKLDLAKTPDGRAFLEEVEKELARSPERVDMTLMVSNEESFVATIKNNAKIYHKAPPSPPKPSRAPIEVLREPSPPPTESPSREAAPAPVEPDLEKRIEDLLKSPEGSKLASDAASGNHDFFKNELFNPRTENAEKIARAWKKVCAKKEFLSHSKALAELRWKMFVDIWAEVARDNAVPIEIIDSGKRNAYGSDIDATIYSPPDKRGTLSIATLIADAEQRFKDRYGYEPAALDMTIHNGDLFMPDPRNNGQSIGEYRNSLRDVVKQLRVKVNKGGDASFVPGANIEDVQKRGMRDGIVTQLEPTEVVSRAEDGTPTETRLKKPTAKELRVSEFTSRGGVAAGSSRFEDLLPAYDRSNAFGNLAQNFEKVLRNGNDHPAVAKLFNRGMYGGAGAGEVNSFLDIHVSDLPPGSLSTDEAARLALEIERMTDEIAKITDKQQKKAKLAQLNELRARGRNKSVAKMRWIIRSFGYNGATASAQNITWLYDLLNTSAAIEADKNNKQFDWRANRERYLKKYLDEARRDHPELGKTPEGVEKLHEEAWRRFCSEMTDAFEIAMVKAVKTALRDLTYRGMKLNSVRAGGPDGAKAAFKIAEQRRVELALLFEILDRYQIKKHPEFDVMTPDEEHLRENRNPQLEALRDAILKNAPDSLKEEIRKLDKIARSQMDNFLNDSDSAGKPREELLKAKEQAVAAVAEIGPEAATRVSDRELREHIERNVLLKTNPADAPLVQKVLDTLAETFQSSTTGEPTRDPRTGDSKARMAGGAFLEQVWQNASNPLMSTSAAVTLTRAYVMGGKEALTEAAIGEAFNFLPPAYGVVGIALKDFSRGRVQEGVTSIAWLAGLHFGEKIFETMYGISVPVGQYMLIYNIVTGVPQIVYTYTTQKINDDLLEQALRSRPVPGKRAARNPYKDSVDLFKGDTPEFPIFWDNPCMSQGVNDLSSKQSFEMASTYFRTSIWKDLVAAGLTPSSPNWDAEWQKQISKYAFDIPYYERSSRIYECYFPKVKELRGKGFDEDNVLKHVFGKVVEEWFGKQPDGYKMEFESVLDTVEKKEEGRKRLLNLLTEKLITDYKRNEDQTFKRQWKLEEIQKAITEQLQRRQLLEKRLLATKKMVLDRIQRSIEQMLAPASNSTPAAAGQVAIKAPTWYVNMSGIIPAEIVKSKTSTGSSEQQSSATYEIIESGNRADDGAIPVDVIAQGDTSAFAGSPETWTHNLKLSLKSISREKPDGFVPSDAERRKLEERDKDNKIKYDVFTIRMMAAASAFDSAGKLIGVATPVPIMGYAIGEAPRVEEEEKSEEKPEEEVPEDVVKFTKEERIFSVRPGQWLSTGIQLKKGQSFDITATGTIKADASWMNREWGPGGFYWLGFMAYTLKGMVGGKLIDIGGGSGGTAPEDGVLQLGITRTYEKINAEDSRFQGSFKVTVTVITPR